MSFFIRGDGRVWAVGGVTPPRPNFQSANLLKNWNSRQYASEILKHMQVVKYCKNFLRLHSHKMHFEGFFYFFLFIAYFWTVTHDSVRLVRSRKLNRSSPRGVLRLIEQILN